MHTLTKRTVAMLLTVAMVLTSAVSVPAVETAGTIAKETGAANETEDKSVIEAGPAEADTEEGEFSDDTLTEGTATEAPILHDDESSLSDAITEEFVEDAEQEESVITEEQTEVRPEDSSDTTDSELQIQTKEEDLVGAGQNILTITWQDNYKQTFVLGNNLQGNACLNESKKILTTMGLPGDTYRMTLNADGTVAAQIVSRDYYSGDNEVRVLAHMGYYKTATRNTLSSYRVARALGFHYVGGDIRFTKDNVPVVVHDGTINATARNADGSTIQGSVVVRQHTYKELLKYDFGLSTNKVWKGEKIPTLEEYLVLCREIGVNPNIHIKADNGLTKSNFEEVANTVLKTGMQGKVTYAANMPWYLPPIVKIDPVSLIDIVVTDKWDCHYITDALSLKTDTNQVELALSRRLYTHDIATTCRYNGILITSLANTEAEAAAFDACVDEIATDGTLPDVIIRAARKRKLHGAALVTTNPRANYDYNIRAHANYGLSIRMLKSMPYTPIRLDKEASAEVSKWRFVRLSNGYYNIVSGRNMYGLGVQDGSKNSWAAVRLTKRNTTYKAQMWEIVHNADGSISFINANSGKALQATGNKENAGSYYCQNTYDGQSAQCFWLTAAATQTNIKFYNEYHSYKLQSYNRAVSIANASTASGANVQVAGNSNNDLQKYRILYSGDGYYRIENVKTGYCLTISGSGKTGNVTAQPWNNLTQQRWKFVWNGSGKGMYPGTYRVMSAYGGTCVTIDGKATSGRNIRADWWTGKPQQQWFAESA